MYTVCQGYYTVFDSNVRYVEKRNKTENKYRILVPNCNEPFSGTIWKQNIGSVTTVTTSSNPTPQHDQSYLDGLMEACNLFCHGRIRASFSRFHGFGTSCTGTFQGYDITIAPNQ